MYSRLPSPLAPMALFSSLNWAQNPGNCFLMGRKKYEHFFFDRACVYRIVFMPAYCKSRPYSIMLGLTCAVIFEGGILRKKYFGTLNFAQTKSSMIASTLPSVKCFMQALSASLLAVWSYVLAILIQLSSEHCVLQHEWPCYQEYKVFQLQLHVIYSDICPLSDIWSSPLSRCLSTGCF